MRKSVFPHKNWDCFNYVVEINQVLPVFYQKEAFMQTKMKCAIYTRVSTDNQAEIEFNSCEAQEEKIRSFIHSQEDMEIYKVYSDPGYTGASINRPALKNLLEDIKQNEINLVVSYKIDRLSRSPKDFYQLSIIDLSKSW